MQLGPDHTLYEYKLTLISVEVGFSNIRVNTIYSKWVNVLRLPIPLSQTM